MLHAYFRPDGGVLFDVFDPQLRCPAASGAAPAAQTGPAPTQAARGLPRTGLVDDGADRIAWLAATGVAMLLGGLVLRRRRA